MDDRRTRQFLTNVGLITTDGPYGPNVMAAEWTHHISYTPSLIAINVRGDATAENIDHSKEFGVRPLVYHNGKYWSIIDVKVVM